ncbi:MAG: cellulase family glycosylhydrolase [Candidatus Sumerlaeota bacterium]|nr:cellulase family glycosylhydrolase [Candidatus Sumerlaeota bacterium]
MRFDFRLHSPWAPCAIFVCALLPLVPWAETTSAATQAPAALRIKDDRPFVRVSPRDPRYFELSDGRPFIPIGLNMVHPNRFTSKEGLEDYDKWMEALSKNGGNFIRIWASQDFWDVEHEKSGQYDEAKARQFDALLEMARRHGIYVKITLEHFRSIGGKPAWSDKPIYKVARGGPADNMTDFFKGQPARDLFRKKLDWYANRFGSTPAVFAWELWNEINATQGEGQIEWTAEMLKELHKRFPKNLCVQSLGSYDDKQWAPKTYNVITPMPDNDIAQVHRYLDLGAKLEVCHGPMDILTADAVREMKVLVDGKKPIMLAETGGVEPRHIGPLKLYAKDKEGTLLHDALFAPFFAGAAGAGQFWHWHQYVAPLNLWRHYARFADAVKGLDPPAEGFEPMMLPHPRLRIYALKGKKTFIAWARDTKNDWRSELEKGEAPERLSGVEIDLPESASDFAQGKSRAYDPWLNQWSSLKANGRKIPLPDFARSLVIRIER